MFASKVAIVFAALLLRTCTAKNEDPAHNVCGSEEPCQAHNETLEMSSDLQLVQLRDHYSYRVPPSSWENGPKCVDDLKWHEVDNDVHTCLWVGEDPLYRCGDKPNIHGLYAWEVCGTSCGLCALPQPCYDDMNWFANGNPFQTCSWVLQTLANDPKACNEKSRIDKKEPAWHACPLACGSCPYLPTQPTVVPKPAGPTPAPEQTQCTGCGPRTLECWNVCADASTPRGYCASCDTASGTKGACCRIDNSTHDADDPAECKATPLADFDYQGYHMCVIPPPCEDNIGFVDEGGYTCDAWVGYDCYTVMEDWYYSQQGMDDLVANCPFACGICHDFPVDPHCDDDPLGWVSSDRTPCARYDYVDFCTPSGGYGTGWLSSYGTFADWANNGISADQACCACGGGNKVSETTPPAPTPAPTTPAPTAAPLAGSPAPTAPTPAPPPTPPTPYIVDVTGDPHLTNLRGERFDLLKPGTHTFIQIPRKAAPQDTLLRVVAEVENIGEACADMYIQTLNVTGQWAEAKLRAKQGKVSTGGFMYNARDTEHQKGTNWLRFGEVELKIVRGHTIEGIKYLNVFARGLGQAGYPVGGLLGEDDHKVVSTPSESCKYRVALMSFGGEGIVHREGTTRSGSIAEASLV